MIEETIAFHAEDAYNREKNDQVQWLCCEQNWDSNLRSSDLCSLGTIALLIGGYQSRSLD